MCTLCAQASMIMIMIAMMMLLFIMMMSRYFDRHTDSQTDWLTIKIVEHHTTDKCGRRLWLPHGDFIIIFNFYPIYCQAFCQCSSRLWSEYIGFDGSSVRSRHKERSQSYALETLLSSTQQSMDMYGYTDIDVLSDPCRSIMQSIAPVSHGLACFIAVFIQHS